VLYGVGGWAPLILNLCIRQCSVSCLRHVTRIASSPVPTEQQSVWKFQRTEEFCATAGKQTTIHLSQARGLWPCYHFNYPQLAPDGCAVNSIWFREKIRHSDDDLAAVSTVASHRHVVIEWQCGSRTERTWWGSGAVGLEDGQHDQTVALRVERTENNHSHI
jgi:hypothetical protein